MSAVKVKIIIIMMSTVSAITLGKQVREQAIQKTTAVEEVLQESVHRIVYI